MGQSCFLILLDRPESFFHGSINLLGSGGIYAVKEVLKAPLVLVVREVHELLQLLLEAVSQETIVDARNARHVDAYDAEILHLLRAEP